jgi:hypothetical protein
LNTSGFVVILGFIALLFLDLRPPIDFLALFEVGEFSVIGIFTTGSSFLVGKINDSVMGKL